MRKVIMGVSSVAGGLGLVTFVLALMVDVSPNQPAFVLLLSLVGLIVGTLFMKD